MSLHVGDLCGSDMATFKCFDVVEPGPLYAELLCAHLEFVTDVWTVSLLYRWLIHMRTQMHTHVLLVVVCARFQSVAHEFQVDCVSTICWSFRTHCW